MAISYLKDCFTYGIPSLPPPPDTMSKNQNKKLQWHIPITTNDDLNKFHSIISEDASAQVTYLGLLDFENIIFYDFFSLHFFVNIYLSIVAQLYPHIHEIIVVHP